MKDKDATTLTPNGVSFDEAALLGSNDHQRVDSSMSVLR
jgi:hypothetical protein